MGVKSCLRNEGIHEPRAAAKNEGPNSLGISQAPGPLNDHRQPTKASTMSSPGVSHLAEALSRIFIEHVWSKSPTFRALTMISVLCWAPHAVFFTDAGVGEKCMAVFTLVGACVYIHDNLWGKLRGLPRAVVRAIALISLLDAARSAAWGAGSGMLAIALTPIADTTSGMIWVFVASFVMMFMVSLMCNFIGADGNGFAAANFKAGTEVSYSGDPLLRKVRMPTQTK